MKIIPKRTLPAVGHKIPWLSFISLFANDKRKIDLRIFSNAYETFYVSSGSAALVVALYACKLASPSKKKVIIPAYTCPSVLAAIEKTGLQAVLCDLGAGLLDINIGQLEKLLDENTLAVVYVHLFGLDQTALKVKKIVHDAGVLLIEDAAQAFGNRSDNKFIGNEGDISILSFGRGKPISALHGGAIIINRNSLIGFVRKSLKNLLKPLPIWFGTYYRILLFAYLILFRPKLFGIPQQLPWFRIGETIYEGDITVSKMAEPAMKVMGQLFEKRKEIQKTRMEVAKNYFKKLNHYSELFLFFPKLSEIKTGPLRFPFVLKNYELKEKCLEILTQNRLGASCSYPTPLNKQHGVPGYVTAQGPFPNATKIAEGIITLPTHEFVSNRDIESIIKMIESAIK